MKDTLLDLLDAPTDQDRGLDGRSFTKTEQPACAATLCPR